MMQRPADAIRPDDLRQTAILRYAPWAAGFRIFAGPAPDAHASLLKLPPPLKLFFGPRPQRRVCALLSR